MTCPDPGSGEDATIFAPASGIGRSAIAIIRVSGSGAAVVLERMLAGPLPPARRASLRQLVDPGSGDILDHAVVLWMPGPTTFTGEDQAELHIHGGLAVRAAVIGALSRLPGCRAAGAGEFTRRAFLNGRMDLSEVEGLADLIDAETEAQRRQALRQLQGALGEIVESVRDRLIDASALIEAALDFADERDVPDASAHRARALLTQAAEEIDRALAGATRGERLRDGFVVVIAGPPNAGKSTLLNALARRDVALVSPTPGTTRDAIEVRCDVDGLPVTFIDTAGLRDSADPIEQAGMARSRARMDSADLVLWLEPDEMSGDALFSGSRPHDEPLLLVRTKVDLADTHGPRRDEDLRVSALTGVGLDRLIAAVAARAAAALGPGDAVATRARHRAALAGASSALGRAEQALAAGHDELAAEDVRLALAELGRITGRVDVDDVLDRIFAQFCIGK